MPDGIVQWFDAATGEGRILRGSRRYAVEASSMEAAARISRARVHFDIDDRPPSDTAINVTAGQDAVLHRAHDGDYHLRYLAGPGSAAVTSASVAVEVDERVAPVLTEAEARAQLDGSDERWVFFRDPASGRGRVVHRRNDGHDGLIEPAEPPTG